MSGQILMFGICNSSVAPLRAEPTHRSEMVSQILFGERVTIINVDESVDNWLYIENHWDGYTGWIHTGHITTIDKKLARKPNKYISCQHNTVLLSENNSVMNVPLGSDLFQIKKGQLDWYFQDVKLKGRKQKIVSPHDELNSEMIVNNAKKYLGAPYLWGGKSIMGIDCSGLSQMAYKLSNIPIKRDASMQVLQGKTVDFIEQAQPGDLAFFDNEDGKIIHVGIMVNNESIIHSTESSGCVVIDSIDNGGIISQKLKKRTHQLRIIKRMI